MGKVLEADELKELVDETLEIVAAVESKDIRRFTAEYINVMDAARISRREILECKRACEVEALLESETGDLQLSVRSYMFGTLEDRIEIHEKYPSDWWQAFKERWFPVWMLRWYPVQYRRIDVDQKIYKAVCPHIYAPERGTHLQWLAGKETETH